MTLTDALADALRPRGLRDRAVMLVAGGFSPTQLLDRLPEALRATLCTNPNPTLARREAIAVIIRALDELIVAGRARRRQVQLKNAMLDVYRLR